MTLKLQNELNKVETELELARDYAKSKNRRIKTILGKKSVSSLTYSEKADIASLLLTLWMVLPEEQRLARKCSRLHRKIKEGL